MKDHTNSSSSTIREVFNFFSTGTRDSRLVAIKETRWVVSWQTIKMARSIPELVMVDLIAGWASEAVEALSGRWLVKCCWSMQAPSELSKLGLRDGSILIVQRSIL
jgi:hypothetical protein